MPNFTPVTKITTNVTKELTEFAKNNKLESKDIDFDILKCETFYSTPKNKEFELLADPLESIISDKELHSLGVELRQEYQIKILPKLPENKNFKFNFSISADKYKSQIYVIVKTDSSFVPNKVSQKLIVEAINKKKLRSGLYINICEGLMQKEILKLLHLVKAKGLLQKPHKMLVGSCATPVDAVNDGVILHYNKKEKKDNQLIDGVLENELVIKYIKPKKGLNGRSCNGKFIEINEPVVKYNTSVTIDNSIRQEENEKTIKYYALNAGFVKRVNKVFTISNSLELKSASFKGTGSIEAGDDKDVDVTVNQKESGLDAIGSGVTIDVNKLVVKGTVGASAKIVANELTVDAQTHSKSKIEVSDKATIHLHRGDLKCKEAAIEILETGRVEADIVRVNQMLGGEIIGHKVYINTLIANANIIASELIEINNIQSRDNHLTIDPHIIPSYHDKIESLEANVKECKQKIFDDENELAPLQKAFAERSVRIKEFQKRIAQATKAGKKPNKADMIRITQFKKESEKLKFLHNEIKEVYAKIEEYRLELDKLYEADVHAKIVYHGTYDGYTKIKFVDSKTKEEYNMLPDSMMKTISLVKSGDEENQKKSLRYDND